MGVSSAAKRRQGAKDFQGLERSTEAHEGGEEESPESEYNESDDAGHRFGMRGTSFGAPGT